MNVFIERIMSAAEIYRQLVEVYGKNVISWQRSEMICGI
jgi:hypothetical protein